MVVNARSRQIDHDHAGLGILAVMRCMFERGGNNAGGKPERRVVGDCQCLIVILHPHHRCHRPEHLLAVDAHAVSRLGEQRRLQVETVSLALDQISAESELAAFFRRRFDVHQVLVELALVHHRADVGTLLERVIDFHAFQPLDQRSDELVVYAFSHDQTGRCGTTLAGGKIRAIDRAFHRDLQVRVVEHHQRVLAAHFELNLGHASDCLGGHLLAGLDRAGEADRIHAPVVDQHFAHHAAAAHDETEHALRNTRVDEDPGNGMCRTGHQIGGLEHHAVAVGQGRSDLPGRNRRRKIPRRDDADHADRFASEFDVDSGAHRWQQLTRAAQYLAGKEFEHVAGPRHFANTFGERLAFLAREQLPEFVLARDDLVAHLVEQVGPGLHAEVRPCREGRAGGLHCPLGLHLVGLRVLGDDVAGVGGIDVLGHGGAGDPLAGDVVLQLCCAHDPSLKCKQS